MKQSDVDLLKSLLIKKSKISSENGVLEIDNTSEGLKARIISIEANKLYQDSREGYNLLKNELNSQTINGVEIIVYDDGSFSLDGTSTGAITLLYTTKTIKLLGDYIFYLYGKTSDKAINLQGVENSSNFTYILSSSNSEYLNKNYTEETELTQLFSYIPTGATFENDVFKPMISKGSKIREFQKYGQKPSLEEKSDVIGLTGDVSSKFNNVNFLNENKLEEETKNGITSKIENDKITYNGTGIGTGAILINSIDVELEEGEYFLNWFGKHKQPYFTLRSQSGTFIQNLVGGASSSNKFTIEEKNTYLIGLHGVSTTKYTPEDTCFTLMISKKNDEKYTEYQSQAHTVSLGSKVLYGDENARDGIVLKDGKWNLKKCWKKYLVTGNENIEIASGLTDIFVIKNAVLDNSLNNNNAYCSHFKVWKDFSESSTNGWANLKDGYCIVGRTSYHQLLFKSSQYNNNLEGFKVKLQELNASGQPLYVVYPLAEPEFEEITDSNLIKQLNNLLYQLTEYDDKTYITADKEIEFEVLVEQDKLRILEKGGNLNE